MRALLVCALLLAAFVSGNQRLGARFMHGLQELPNSPGAGDFPDQDDGLFDPAAQMGPPPVRGGLAAVDDSGLLGSAAGGAGGAPEDAEFAEILRIQSDLRAKKALVAHQHAVIAESEEALRKYSELLETNKKIYAANEQKLGETVAALLAAVQKYKDKLASGAGAASGEGAAPAADAAAAAAPAAASPAAAAPAAAAPAAASLLQHAAADSASASDDADLDDELTSDGDDGGDDGGVGGTDSVGLAAGKPATQLLERTAKAHKAAAKKLSAHEQHLLQSVAHKLRQRSSHTAAAAGGAKKAASKAARAHH